MHAIMCSRLSMRITRPASLAPYVQVIPC